MGKNVIQGNRKVEAKIISIFDYKFTYFFWVSGEIKLKKTIWRSAQFKFLSGSLFDTIWNFLVSPPKYELENKIGIRNFNRFIPNLAVPSLNIFLPSDV